MSRVTWTAVNSEGRPAPAALSGDAVVLAVRDGQLAALVVTRHEEPFAGANALPGALVRPDEEPAAAAARALADKAGVPPVYLEQLRTYATPGRDPRGWVVAVAHLALLPTASVAAGAGATWVTADSPGPLAFDHATILADGVERLRWKLWTSNLAVGLLPATFTLAEARAAFEAALGRELDPGNFQRDLLATGLVAPTGELRRPAGGGRPGRLFAFVDRSPTWAARERRR